MAMWTENAAVAFILTFVNSFIFWALYFTACEIEMPFQHGHNNYKAKEQHREFNMNLLQCAAPSTGRTPHLRKEADTDLKKVARQSLHQGPKLARDNEKKTVNKIFGKRESKISWGRMSGSEKLERMFSPMPSLTRYSQRSEAEQLEQIVSD